MCNVECVSLASRTLLWWKLPVISSYHTLTIERMRKFFILHELTHKHSLKFIPFAVVVVTGNGGGVEKKKIKKEKPHRISMCTFS